MLAGRVSFNLVFIWAQRKKFHYFTDNKTVVERNCMCSVGCTTYLHLQLTGSSGLLHSLCPGFSEKRAPSIFRVTRVQDDSKSLTLKMEVGRSYRNNEGTRGNHLVSTQSVTFCPFSTKWKNVDRNFSKIHTISFLADPSGGNQCFHAGRWTDKHDRNEHISHRIP